MTLVSTKLGDDIQQVLQRTATASLPYEGTALSHAARLTTVHSSQ